MVQSWVNVVKSGNTRKSGISKRRVPFLIVILVLGNALLSYGLTGCSTLEIPFLNAVTGSNKSSRTVLLTTSANDIKVVCPIDVHLLDGRKQIEVKEWPTKPGYYRMKLESYCLHAGAYAPTEGTGFQLVPLKGPLAPQIKAILINAEKHPEIKQQTIQRLLWAMLAGVGYEDLDPLYKVAATALMPPDILAKYVGMQSVAPKLIDAALPDEFGEGLDFIREFRSKVNNANTKFEELERMAVLHGEPKTKETIKVPAGSWNITPHGNLWRIRTGGYWLAIVDYYIPYPARIERDSLHRITHFEFPDKGFSVECSFKDGEYFVTDPETGKQRAVWRYDKMVFKKILPETGELYSFEVAIDEDDENGWIYTIDSIMDILDEDESVQNSQNNNDLHFMTYKSNSSDTVLVGDWIDRARWGANQGGLGGNRQMADFASDERQISRISSAGNTFDASQRVVEDVADLKAYGNTINSSLAGNEDAGGEDEGNNNGGKNGDDPRTWEQQSDEEARKEALAQFGNQSGNNGIQREGVSTRHAK